MKQIIAMALLLMCSSFGYAQRNNNNGGAATQKSQTSVSRPKQNGGIQHSSSNKRTENKLTPPERHPQEVSTEVFHVNGVSFKMCYVKGGAFLMGATPEQKNDNYNAEPMHKVSLDDYFIGQTEVTRSLWYAVMEDEVYNNNTPMNNISYADCDKFIVKLNSLTGLIFRLPTEEEWEFACRGGNNSKDYMYSGSNYLEDVAWYKYNSGSQLHNVATKQANELGIYDMCGNVMELCAKPQSSNFVIGRGGDFQNEDKYCKNSSRSPLFIEGKGDYRGFRLALTRIPPQYREQELERKRKFVESTKGTINGHEWIDLGLSVKWATCNVGANTPSDYGGYFAWGETKTKTIYIYNTCFDCINYNSPNSDGSWRIYNKINGKKRITRNSGQDTAFENWSGTWRMPTDAEMEELRSKCKWNWTSMNGHNGYIVKGPNGNSIFLPAAGRVWSTEYENVGSLGAYWVSVLYTSFSYQAFCLLFDDTGNRMWNEFRPRGCCVRPVTE